MSKFIFVFIFSELKAEDGLEMCPRMLFQSQELLAKYEQRLSNYEQKIQQYENIIMEVSEKSQVCRNLLGNRPCVLNEKQVFLKKKI